MNALITFAELRNRLLEIETCLRNGDFVAADELVRDVRRRCRLLAYTLEQSSGAKPHRAAVLQTLEPFGSTPHACRPRDQAVPERLGGPARALRLTCRSRTERA